MVKDPLINIPPNIPVYGMFGGMLNGMLQKNNNLEIEENHQMLRMSMGCCTTGDGHWDGAGMFDGMVKGMLKNKKRL